MASASNHPLEIPMAANRTAARVDPTEALVQVERGEGHLRIALNRPVALNSLSPDMIDAMNAALDGAQADRALRVLIITGTGRAFCAGADLKAARARVSSSDGDAVSARFVASVGTLCTRIECFPRPVLAAVNGLTLAGGLELMLACDLAIATAGAKIGDAHANFGLLPGGGGSVRLPRRIGASRAKRLMYTGELLTAARAAEWGLVDEVVADDAFDAAIARLVDQLVAKSPLGLERMKQLIHAGLELPKAAGLQQEQWMSALHARSHDRREGLAAFAEKRAPLFTGI